jgi:ABC-type antimicrobial peptide transport system permease subunit
MNSYTGGDNNTKQPINSFATNLPIPIPVSIVDGYTKGMYINFQKTINLFVIVALSITTWLLIILSNEIVDGTKKESSVLKALGYKNRTATSLVLDGSNLVVILGMVAAIPITQIVVTSLNSLMITLIGSPINITIATGSILIGFAGAIIVISIIYLMGFYMFKKISPLLALQ